MIKRNDEFEKIADIMLRFGKKVPLVRPKTRGYTAKDERLVHVLKLDHVGATNSHGPGVAWDEMYMDSANGVLRPDLSPKTQAMFVKDKGAKTYTFRGVYEVDTACSTEFKMIFRRIATEVDETLPEWRIVRVD